MATHGHEDVFEVSILLLKVLPNGVELIKDNRFMERQRSNINKQWGARLKKNNKRVTSPNLP